MNGVGAHDLLKLYNIKPVKRLSQNFLLSSANILQFRTSVGTCSKSLVVEIGSGPGGLSRGLVKSGARMVVGVEVDSRFEPMLDNLRNEREGKFDYIIGSALEHRSIIDQVAVLTKSVEYDNIKIVGNLPFEISGQLLNTWNNHSLLKEGFFGWREDVEMTLIFSASVARRLLPNFSKRTRFSTFTQTAFDVSEVGFYPKESFTPIPKTDAVALKFINRKKKLFESKEELDNYVSFLKKVYTLPNKQMGRACSSIPGCEELLKQLGIDRTQRIFAVPIRDLIRLSKLLNQAVSG